MSKSPIVFHTASIVAQSKKDRAPGLGRGPGSKNLLQSPKHLSSLKLLQININDITSTTARFKLGQVYNSKKALDVTIVSPDLSPACNWKVLENIGSDHLPILFELNKRQTTYKISNRRWNFKRADRQAYTDRAEKLICAEPLTDNLGTDWLSFKRTIYCAAGQSIPRGKLRRKRP
ncbi:uncharacterized protein TNCV_3303411 [Trichonephila clavipes]|nr:uncharacterized protein TNCV_3303411 [Trichonephila clavipes]